MADAACMRMFMRVEQMEIAVALFDRTEFPWGYQDHPSRRKNGDEQIVENSEVETRDKLEEAAGDFGASW